MENEVCENCQLDGLDIEENGAVCRLKTQKDICEVQNHQGHWVHLGFGEITIDSAADESCWPLDYGGAFQVTASKRNLRLKAANGADMAHAGEKEVTFKDAESGTVLGMTFQVTEVKKALAAVWRLTEKGNVVQFGPGLDQNFILNVQSGKKIMLHRRGGSYVMKVEYVKWTPVFQGQA